MTNKLVICIKRFFIILALFILSQIGSTLFSLPSIGGPEFSTTAVFIVTLITIIISLWIAKNINIITFDLKWITKKNILSIISMIIILRVLAIVMTLIIQLTSGEATSANDAVIQELFADANPFILFFLIAIVAPIMEEIIFRGGIIGYFFKEYQKVGLIVSSLLFGALHSPSDLINFSIYVLMGFCIGYCYYKSQRLEVSIAVHFLNNAIGALAMIFLL